MDTYNDTRYTHQFEKFLAFRIVLLGDAHLSSRQLFYVFGSANFFSFLTLFFRFGPFGKSFL